MNTLDIGGTLVLSLPERHDRRERITKHLLENDVPFEFVDGLRIPFEELRPEQIAGISWTNWKKKSQSFEGYAAAAWGCNTGHRNAHLLALQKGWKLTLILEDDAELLSGWRAVLESALAAVPDDFCSLYLGCCPFVPSTPIHPNLDRVNGAWHASSILYSQAGLRAALDLYEHCDRDMDDMVGRTLHPSGRYYCTNPMIAGQLRGFSDLLGREVAHFRPRDQPA